MKNLFVLLFIASFYSLFSQLPLRCGFVEAREILFQQDPQAKQREIKNLQDSEFNNTVYKTSAVPVYTIPVVFHILHLGGPENISDAQIMDALAILNRDFNKENADTTNIVAAFQNLAADCNIEFRLATVDENGNCTTGITRHYDTNTDWAISPSYYKYTWNRTRYLNIYVVRSLPPNVAAYTYLPGTASAVTDAIVALNNYVGSIGTAWAGGSRTLTHEVGHWFNLQHTWGSNNQPGVACGDDGVGDTPLTKGFSFCNLSNSAQCTPGVQENVQNYMEYAFCSNMFTQGQRNRIHNALNSSLAGRVNLWSPSNLQFTGVFNPPLNCAPKADFKSNVQVACVGDTVYFTDYSYNAPVLFWQWSSPGATNVSTLQQGKMVFNIPGPASVKLRVSNTNGSDSIVKQLLMILPASSAGTMGLSQGFETGTFPDSYWQRTIPEYGSAFQTTTLSARTGSQSLWINNFYDNPNGKVAFFSPSYNFQSFSPSLLNFYYAYAQKSGASNDLLKVFASTNCGTSWTEILSLQGANLSTVGTASNTAFFPSPGQYSLASVNLNAFANQYLFLKFEFTPDPTGPGNNLYIDDINLTGLTGVFSEEHLAELKVHPNPFMDIITVSGLKNLESCRAELTDLLGQVILSNEIDPNFPSIQIPQGLPKGIYFLCINSSGHERVFKLIRSE